MSVRRFSSFIETTADQSMDDKLCGSILTKTSFLCAHPRLYIAFYDERQAQKMAHHSLKVKYIMVPMASALKDDSDIRTQNQSIVPSSLIDIYDFNEMANQIARKNGDHRLVFSAGSNVKIQIKVVFLIGCHMILSQGLDADQIFAIFRSFEELFVDLKCSQVNILDCWRALHRSTCAGWIDFRERFGYECDRDQTIDMEEFIHYSRSVAISLVLKQISDCPSFPSPSRCLHSIFLFTINALIYFIFNLQSNQRRGLHPHSRPDPALCCSGRRNCSRCGSNSIHRPGRLPTCQLCLLRRPPRTP